MPPRRGDLRHRITIEQVIETTDANGTITEEWITFATRWASVEPLEGRELFEAHQVNAEVSHRIRLWWLHGVIPKMRMKFRNRIFTIDSVTNPAERNQELLVMCHEAV
jgi:SPP1 family predicted phage head-tail adaptor